MISAAAIAAAIAFWTPYNAGVPPCTSASGRPAVQVGIYGPHTIIRGLGVGREFDAFTPAHTGPSCRIFLRSDTARGRPRAQCAVIAHELGHSWFSLPHTDDPTNVMYPRTDGRTTPRTCRKLPA